MTKLSKVFQKDLFNRLTSSNRSDITIVAISFLIVQIWAWFYHPYFADVSSAICYYGFCLFFGGTIGTVVTSIGIILLLALICNALVWAYNGSGITHLICSSSIAAAWWLQFSAFHMINAENNTITCKPWSATDNISLLIAVVFLGVYGAIALAGIHDRRQVAITSEEKTADGHTA